MIKKFININNVGKFRNYKARGDLTFRPLTLLYAENGRGKTTLCDIFHSLRTNKSEYITGRKTLDCTGDQFVEIRLETGSSIFKNGTWSNQFNNIAIFDSSFVNQNVYSGDSVSHDNKKNLYRIIIGEKGVELARSVNKLDDKIRDLNKDISTHKRTVEKFVSEGIRFDDFINLEEDIEIDGKIKKAKKDVDTLKSADDIIAKKSLGSVTLPSLPSDFKSLLAKNLEDVSKNAESLIQKHLKLHTNDAVEPWLTEGLEYVKGETCPFCGQSIKDNALIESYRTYFGESYNTLKEEISKLLNDVSDEYGETALLDLQKTTSVNERLVEFWKQFIDFDKPILSFDINLKGSLNELRTVAIKYVHKKVEMPLDSIVPATDYEDAVKKIKEAQKIVDVYNSNIESINKLIKVKKDAAAAGDLIEAKNKLRKFRAKKKRHEKVTKDACKNYLAVKKDKSASETQKENAKKELDNYTAEVIPKYEKRINMLLDTFNADFRICGTKRTYIGGSPSTIYQIKINGIPVTLGDSESSIGRPCFKNTLSAGDRSTLALAFFVAQMEFDSDLENKVMIFDDPFTSQDRSRRTHTQQLLCRLLSSCKQIIILSHNPGFLKLVWDNVNNSTAKALQLSRIGNDTIITDWDIEEETMDEYVKNHTVLSKFKNEGNGDKRLVAKTIRPTLEYYLRVKFPDQFTQNEWLGDFISKIRDAGHSNVLSGAKGINPVLESINSYSKKYHHSTNNSADSEPIDDGELNSFVRKTLSLVGGF